MDITNLFTIQTISLMVTAFFNLILFIVIVFKNNKTKNIYYFLGFILSMFMWIVTTLFFYLLDGQALGIETHLIYFGPAFIPMFMILFIKTFPKQPLDFSKIKLFIFLALPFIFSVLTLLPNVIIKGAYLSLIHI